MSSLKHKSTKIKSKSLTSGKLFLGSVLATFIAITPILFNLYKSVPETRVWDTFLFTYESNYYEDVSVVVWTLMNKLVPLFLLFIWFFTNRHWWYHAILVPIAMYIYQIVLTLKGDVSVVDTNLIEYLLPIMAVIVPSIYLIRARMFNKINDADKTLEELEEEFKVGGKGFWGKISDYF